MIKDEIDSQEMEAENPPFKKTPPATFVKLAMRNMVKKGSQSLLHFGFTAIGFLLFILLIAWLGRPNIPTQSLYGFISSIS